MNIWQPCLDPQAHCMLFRYQFLFNLLYVRQLKYSISLNAGHDQLVYELMGLYDHELIQR